MEPRILVGCPTHESQEYALKEYAKAVKSLTYKNFEILLVDNSEGNEYLKKPKKHALNAIKGPSQGSTRERIMNSRNILRKKFLEGNYDYLLSLEQDVIPPPNIIETLISRNTPVISGLYFNIYTNNFGKKELKPVAYAIVSDAEFEVLKTDTKYEGTAIRRKIESGRVKGPQDINAQLSSREVLGNKLLNVFFTGLGCMLIKREVLEKIKFRYTETSFDDYAFCFDAQINKYKIWLDTSARCNHLINPNEKDKRD